MMLPDLNAAGLMIILCKWHIHDRADSRFALSQWEMTLLCNHVSHWLGTNLESALHEPNSLHTKIEDSMYSFLTQLMFPQNMSPLLSLAQQHNKQVWWWSSCDIIVTTESAWWLLMARYLFDTRASATMMMMWTGQSMSAVPQHYAGTYALCTKQKVLLLLVLLCLYN